ncbi:MAG: rRNA pseudouridine synthase [Chloroflexi bacterium]|nr:rRNA pseudouridine synthase [Chloroflexota bacterium]
MTKEHQPHEERLQKVLAHAGVASRRASEALIEQGRVTVNGQTVTVLGTKVDPQRDVIAVDGRQLPKSSTKPIYIILNKPRDVLTAASDDRGRQTVVDLVEVAERVYPVGRLDLKSEGLVLLTNDGELAETLTHPRSHVEKEYLVLVSGRPSTPTLARWRRGEIEVEGKPVGRAMVERLKIEGDNTWLKIILTEGRKRQIREVARILGHPVIRLERIRIGPIKLGHLKPGRWRHLSSVEVEQLKRSVKVKRERKA